MDCAICRHRGRFRVSGRADGRKLYRCPKCKYDQTRTLTGQGQYGYRSLFSNYKLDFPPETSIPKLMYELHMADSGVIPRSEVLTPTSPEHFRQLAMDFFAEGAEEVGADELAELARSLGVPDY